MYPVARVAPINGVASTETGTDDSPTVESGEAKQLPSSGFANAKIKKN